MELWLKGNGRRVRIPVLPPEYKVTSNQNNTTVNVIGLGEVTLKGKRGLQEITFSSFFPHAYDSSFCEFQNIRSPRSYVDSIEKMKQEGTVKLIITGTPVNFRCTIESFEWGENDRTGDIAYTLTFKEYRSPSTGTSSVVIG